MSSATTSTSSRARTIHSAIRRIAATTPARMIDEFIAPRLPTADATEPGSNGYLFTVACSCSVTFERWVTPWDAELDLLRMAGLN